MSISFFQKKSKRRVYVMLVEDDLFEIKRSCWKTGGGRSLRGTKNFEINKLTEKYLDGDKSKIGLGLLIDWDLGKVGRIISGMGREG